MESITIINKSGKVVSTGKHLVNIFKEAKEAYQEKKAALHAEHQARIREKTQQRLERVREETQSVASSRHSRSSHRSSKSRKHKSERGGDRETRPPLTERNLSQIDEGSVISSSTARKSRRSASHHGSRSLRDGERGYHKPYLQDAEPSSPSLVRRHTDFPTGTPPLPIQTTETQLTRSTVPPSYHTYAPPLHRSSSLPEILDEGIDMNLAYGPTPHPSSLGAGPDAELKLATSMSRLDSLLLEAHCLQHSATAIITNLQNNPEAMAAVALTLAEISSLLTKMSPGIIATLKAGSPAIFALLACPQFLIGTGVMVGVTVIVFGGYKIIKKMQQNIEDKEAHRMEEALVYEPEIELSSIDTWRRGIAEVEAQSVSTSVDGEFITPEAARQRKERIRDRAREERIIEEEGSVISKRSKRTVRTRNSEETIRPEIQISPASESGSKRSNKKKSKGKEILMIEDAPKERKSKRGGSTISSLFKKKDRKLRDEDARESVLSLRPKTVEF